MTSFTLLNERARQVAIAEIQRAPDGYRVTVEESKRSDDASARFWAALRQFAAETDHHGEVLPAELWRDIFINTLRGETRWVRRLEGDGIMPVRVSTKALSVREMSDLIEMVYSTGARRGIVFREPRFEPDWKPKRVIAKRK